MCSPCATRARTAAKASIGSTLQTPASLSRANSAAVPWFSSHTGHHRNHITAKFQTASFKSLYQERSGDQDSHLHSRSVCRNISDTALRLLDHIIVK